MFILSISYIVPVEDVNLVRDAHLAWLSEGHKAGHFLAWGRKTPATGGIVLARGGREQVEALAQTDPYIQSKVATVEVIEWTPGFLAEGLEALNS